MTATCTICWRPLPDDTDRYACQACEHTIAYALHALTVTELPLLRAALAPGASPRIGTRSASRAHAPLPVNLAALDLLGPGATATVTDPHHEQTPSAPLGALLLGWAECIAREHSARHFVHGTEYRVPCTPALRTARGSIPAWGRWLTAYLPYAVARPWIAEMHAELDHALRRVRAITGTRPRTHPRLAPCPACAAFGLCRTDGQWEIRCTACGHRMDPDAYDAHAAQVLPGLTPTTARPVAAEHPADAA